MSDYDFIDPERGCGHKQYDSCYAEGEIGLGGILSAWTWLLGDGCDRYISMQIPPRTVMLMNPLASIVFGFFIGEDWPIPNMGEYQSALYDRLVFSTKTLGVVDHVGADNYSPYSFATEAGHYGPSRRIPKEMAKILVGKIFHWGSLPIMFTHSQMPLFEGGQLREAKEIVAACLNERGPVGAVNWSDRWMLPVWDHPQWGQYSINNQWSGFSHWLVPVLDLLNDLEDYHPRLDSPAWDRAREFFNGVRFTEQPFGMSWLTKVSYTLDEDEKGDPEMLEIPGINVINLKQIREGLQVLEEEEHEETLGDN